jgi:hypothetical protein
MSAILQRTNSYCMRLLGLTTRWRLQQVERLLCKLLKQCCEYILVTLNLFHRMMTLTLSHLSLHLLAHALTSELHTNISRQHHPLHNVAFSTPPAEGLTAGTSKYPHSPEVSQRRAKRSTISKRGDVGVVLRGQQSPRGEGG